MTERTPKVHRRCGCRQDGKQYPVLPEDPTNEQRARACPRMTDPKHGAWTYRLTAGNDPRTGKRVVINGKSYPTARAAKAALRRDLVAKDDHKLEKRSSETIASYAPQWLRRRQTTGKRPLKATTAANYARYIEQDIAPSALGRMRIADVRRRHVEEFCDALTEAGRGATTVNRILAVVQSILTGAVESGLVELNVARGVSGPTVQGGERELWSLDELATFLEAAQAHRLGALFEFTLFTALRRGEVTGLRWSDVDFDRGLVRIRNNRVKIDAETFEQTPKTAASVAVVALPAEALAALRSWQGQQDLERLQAAEAWQESGYVFTMEDGRPLDPAYVTRLFDKLRAGADLPKMTFHGLRHLAATMMWESGQDIARVSKALRHSSVSVTSEVYAHMRADVQRETLGAVASRLRGSLAHTSHTHA